MVPLNRCTIGYLYIYCPKSITVIISFIVTGWGLYMLHSFNDLELLLNISGTCVYVEEKSKCPQYTDHFIGYDVEPDNSHDKCQGNQH